MANKVLLLTIASSLLLGLAYDGFRPLLGLILCSDFFHDYLSGCPCIEVRHRGEDFLSKHKLVGLNENEILRTVGKPSWSRKVDPSERWADGKIDEIWNFSGKGYVVFIHIRNNTCIKAEASSYVFH